MPTRWLIALAFLPLLLGACGATRHPPLGIPGDFALGVTVLGSTEASPLPRNQRPAQYLVEADGVFRVAVGAGVDPSTYPPRIRRLSTRQVERLWSLVDAAGLSAPEHAGRLENVANFRPSPREGWALFDVTAKGHRQAIAVRVDADEAAARVIDELAGLAWIRP